MWEKVLNLALSNGLWAVLFLGLLIYQLKDSRAREQKYQKTIETLGKSLEIVNDVKEDVEEIKQKINSLSNKKPTKVKKETKEIKVEKSN